MILYSYLWEFSSVITFGSYYEDRNITPSHYFLDSFRQHQHDLIISPSFPALLHYVHVCLHVHYQSQRLWSICYMLVLYKLHYYCKKIIIMCQLSNFITIHQSLINLWSHALNWPIFCKSYGHTLPLLSECLPCFNVLNIFFLMLLYVNFFTECHLYLEHKRTHVYTAE